MTDYRGIHLNSAASLSKKPRPPHLAGHVQHPEAPSRPRHERHDARGRLRPLSAESQGAKGGQNGKSCLEYSRPGAGGVR